ncbi:cytochrome P450 monooxygenase [Penicillium brasilianum]|uniref:Cytochrome P450 monooxygenase n=1 Tax=Penicillium brasilianum TaxID=104259 RepID=A0A1S9RWA4_PENBI|nr:cytochrome P450 monooxygenase [Penicillium brasilianum]
MSQIKPLEGELFSPGYGLAICLLLILLYTRRLYGVTSPHIPKLPPGPRSLPLIGNLHQIPRQNHWKTVQQWHEIYGPIISFRLGQRVAVSLGSHWAARQLLSRRGNACDSRPRLVVAGDCINKGLHPFLLPYGSRWRLHHRIQLELLAPHRIRSYRSLQDIESRQLLYDMLSSNDFSSHLRRYTASLVFTLAYGKRIDTLDREEINEAHQITEKVAQAANQMGNLVVEAFPVLDYLPGFLAPWRRIGNQFYERTLSFFTHQMLQGQRSPTWNWTKHVIEMKESETLDTKEIAYLLGALYEGGSETTAAAIEIFVLACVLHPECVKHAQIELDQVVGSNRLPCFSDKAHLSYICAFTKEVLRWRPLTPLGVPHAPTQDIDFLGYHIPAGTTIFPNNWTIDQDNEVFEDSCAFRPSRWLEEPSLPLSTFGFGRRACVGKVLAENSLYLVISRLLWGYNISRAVENGLKVHVDPWNMKQGIISAPAPFRADFQVRSEDHGAVIKFEWESAEKDGDLIMSKINSAVEK